MSFGNLYFIFVYLPIALLLYYVIPERFIMVKNVVLLILSLLFFSWSNPSYIIMILFSIIFNYVSAIEMDHFDWEGDLRARKIIMIITVAVDVFTLCFFKYYSSLIELINHIFGSSLPVTKLSSPIGISFYTFTVLSYIFDLYYRKAEVQKNLINFGVFVTFFPKLVSGPIVEYRDMEEQLTYRRYSAARFGSGTSLLLIGLAKKVILADNLGLAFNSIHELQQMSVLSAWLGMIFYSIELYFDFSGYSDMAIGIAQMFGFEFKKNFDYPYLSKSVSEFWRRWHISLGSWFRDYVYIPLGGNRCSSLMNARNLLIVWLLTGIWHGSTLNFVVWGLWHGAFVLLEKFLLKDPMERWPGFLRVTYVVFEAFLGWVWFFNDSLGSSLHYFGQMFGMGHMGLIDSTGLYYLSSYLILLIISIIGCGPLVHKLHYSLTYKLKDNAVYVSIAAYVVLFFLCIAYMVNSTYTSFLYFQF